MAITTLAMKILPVIVLLFWGISGLYFGVAGLTRAKLDETLLQLDQDREVLVKDTINMELSGVALENRYQLKYFMEISSTEKVFPWVMSISSFMSLILTSFAFGLLGAIIHLLKEIALEEKDVNATRVYSIPLLGMFSGLIILGISFILPTVLVKGAGEIRPLTLMFLSLFGGLYVSNLHDKLSGYFGKLFL
jgi:hypothetical protein